MRRLALFSVVALVGCAGLPRRSPPQGADGLLQAIATDEHDSARVAFARWIALLEGPGRRDEALALFALDRLDAAFVDGTPAADAELTLRRVATTPLSDEARRQLALVRARAARLGGDEQAALGFEHEAGCGLPWRAGAIVGRLPRTSLARPPGDATATALLTPARTRGCRVVALTPDARPAALPLVLDFELAQAGVVELHVGTETPYQLWVDDHAGAAPDDRAPVRQRRRYRVALAAGAHRIVLSGAAPYGRLDVELALVAAPALGLRVGTSGVRGQGAVSISEVPPSVALAPAKIGRIESVYLEAASAQRAGDGARARVAAQRLVEGSPKLGIGLALAARIAAEDSTVPARLARDRARRLFERALEADPLLARARYEAGRLALERDRAREAIELAESAPEPRSLRVALLHAEALRARGRDAEVRDALSAVPAEQRNACAYVEAMLADDRLRHEPVSLERARRVAACRVGVTGLGDALRQRGSLDDAITEYRRVLAADPLGESVRVSLGETLLQRGRALEAAGVFEGLVAIARRSAMYRVRLIDALYAAGKPGEARRALDDGLALDPENAELAAAGRSLGRTAIPGGNVDVDRVDGRKIITDFERARRRYDGPAVFVLDRTVSRVYATGAQRTITHNIVKVLAKEGIDRWGEWKVPQNAEVLTLCAWKPDGSRLEPEEVPEKETISIPGLAAGDYVEVEYLERAAPPAAFPDGFLGERFYFASLDAPLDHSEYLLVTPKAMQVDVDTRGGAPAPLLSERDEPLGPVTVRTYSARSVPQRYAEPGAAPISEYVASVRARSRVSRAAWREFLVDLTWGSRRHDPALDELAARIVGKEKDAQKKLRLLDAWVRANVQQGGGLEEAATAILARREGNRVTLLSALCEAAGLPTRLVLARSARAPAIEDELEAYDQAVVEVAGMFDDPRYRHGLPGELPAFLRGVDALVIEPGQATPIKLPTSSTDARHMQVDITLDAAGAGKVSVEETLRGWPALEWRESLERLPADRVRPQFEQRTLGYYFPGAVLHELSWDGADRDDQPFVVRYTLEAPGIARRQGSSLVLPAPFAAQLLKRYATGAPRTMPLFIDEVSPTELALRVHLPPGAAVVVSPPVARVLQIGRFEQSAELAGAVLTLRSRFFMPTQRVALSGWPALLEWLAVVDQAEAAIARILVPATSRTGLR